jgi:hypothetical protein
LRANSIAEESRAVSSSGFCATTAAVLALPDVAIGQNRRGAEEDGEAGPGLAGVPGLRRQHGVVPARQPPTAAEVVLDTLSVDYHETIMAAAGTSGGQPCQAVKERAGNYIAVVEGAIPTGANGAYCTIGGRAALISLARSAAAPRPRSPSAHAQPWRHSSGIAESDWSSRRLPMRCQVSKT